MAKKMVMPVAWAQDVDCWLETLKAAGFSDDTVRSRRYKIARLCRELPSPMETTGEQITRVFAAHDWKPETRKGYRNTIAGFYRWFYETGRRGDNPTAKVPKVKKPQAHPHPCPDKYILMALGKATEDERRMIRLAAECGLRRSEIAAVNSDDVMDDLLGKSLIVRGKGDKQRIVPCPDDWPLRYKRAAATCSPADGRDTSKRLTWASTLHGCCLMAGRPTRYGTGTPPEPMSQHMTCTW